MIDLSDRIASDANAGAALRAVNPHCLENLVRYAQETLVIAVGDVVDEHGAIVLHRGEALSRARQSTLAGRRLRLPLEACLKAADELTLARVVDDAGKLMRTTDALALLGGSPGVGRALGALAALPLDAPLALLLGAARQTRRSNYDNSLAALLVGAALAAGLPLRDGEGEQLMLAALLQDIGEAYLDPDLLGAGGALPLSRWARIAAHPLLGEALVRAFSSSHYAPTLAECVVQHHERQDGGGYPRAHRAATMTPLGILLGVADCVAALIMGGGSPGELARAAPSYASLRERVAIALGFVADEFPPAAVAVVNAALAPLAACGEASGSGGSYAQLILPTLQRIRAARLYAQALARRTPSVEINACAEFARSTVLAIEKRLRASGVYDLAQPGRLEGDARRMAQARLVIDEASWRLRHLARNVYVRAEQCGFGDDPAIAELVAALGAEV